MAEMEDFFRCRWCVTYECLLAPWVPQKKLKECINIWRREARRIPNFEETEPPPNQKVLYLQAIAPEEMTDFFRRNCQS